MSADVELHSYFVTSVMRSVTPSVIPMEVGLILSVRAAEKRIHDLTGGEGGEVRWDLM